MYFQELIECPECGLHTHELTKSTSNREGEKVLMCDVCRMDTGDSLEEWDEGCNWHEN